MAVGTGFGTAVSFLGIAGLTGTLRARTVEGPTGRGREPVDFSDLDSVLYEDVRPGDLVAPGTLELTFVYDPDGTDASNYISAADFKLLVESGVAASLVVARPDGIIETFTGFTSDSTGPSAEINTAQEVSITWQNSGAEVITGS